MIKDFDVNELGFESEYDKNDIDLSEFEVLNINDLEIGDTFTGMVSCRRMNPMEDKNYTSICLRLINEEENEVLDCYANVPLDYPTLKLPIRRSNNFMKTGFDFIMSTMAILSPESVTDKNGNEKNIVNGINFQKIIEFYNSDVEKATVEIIAKDDYYNSFKVTSLE